MSAALTSVSIAWALVGGGCVDILDDVERARMAAISAAAERARYLTAHSLRRSVLAELLGVQPDSFRFTARCADCGGPHGRPDPVIGPDRRSWFTSLAHAGDRVLVGATTLGPVGVDVETVSAVRFAGFDAVALAPAEQGAVGASDQDRRRARLWTLKEAAVKATGDGFRVPPDQVVVSGLDSGMPRLAAWGTNRSVPALRLAELDAGPDHAAAVAVLGSASLRLRVVSEPQVGHAAVHAQDGAGGGGGQW